MTRTIDDVCWHDMEIIAMKEICETDGIELLVSEDISRDSDGTKYETITLYFDNVTKLNIDEGPVFGNPVVADVLIDVGNTKGGQCRKLVITTNAGHREIYYGQFRG